eukprot:SAG31_NODE_1416_length_8441_cov_11.436706_10_plen_104_part_00
MAILGEGTSGQQLVPGSRGRMVGRFLIPSLGQSFGSGQVIRAPNDAFVYVHHHLNHTACVSGVWPGCRRDVWISPIEFEDRGDGRGDVWIRPRFPAEEAVPTR